MSGLPDITFDELAHELRVAIGCDVGRNDTYEQFIASCDPATVDTRELELSLVGCRRATERLAELHRIVTALAPYETEVRALYQQLSGQAKRGPSAAA